MSSMLLFTKNTELEVGHRNVNKIKLKAIIMAAWVMT